MKKKILFVSPNMHQGGAESVLVKILNNINLSIYEVKLVLVKKEGEHLQKLSNEIEIIDLDCQKSILSIPKLIKVINKEKPSFVFSIIGQMNLILAVLKIFFFKKIYFIGRENAVYSEWLYKDINIKKRLFSMAYKLFLKKLDYIIVQSTFMAKQVVDYFNVNPNNIVILNNPIEHERIEALCHEHDLGCKWNDDKINLIAVGRIEKVKNYTDMIDIIGMLPEKFHLNIFGDGNERNELEKYIGNKRLWKRVTIYGYVENPYKYMKRSFALLLTSLRESFPNVAIEANACGIYVISYNMPGGISEIIVNGLNGCLVSQGNKQEFVDRVLEKYNKGYNSQKIINYSKKYSIDTYMKSIYDLFKQ